MLQRVRPFLAICLLACTAACGSSDNDPGPGGVTVGEAHALDEAAEIIEQQRLPEDALPLPSGEEPPKPPETQQSSNQ